MSIAQYFSDYLKDISKESVILEDATENLIPKDLKTLKDQIEATKAAKSAVQSQSDYSLIDNPDAKTGPKKPETLSENELEKFWEELEKMDPVDLISESVVSAFQYVGFNPDTILREILLRGRQAGKGGDRIKQDIVEMVMMAVIKGSITDNNLKKTSDEGKVIYKKFADDYKLIQGGGKGKDANQITISRIAAAMPGLVVQVIQKRPDFSKTFVGPFGARSLPPCLRHQAAAACIPESSSEKLKDYLIGLITAYTSDQSKVISKTKDSAEEIYDRQLNFVTTTHGSKHPSESHRKKIFSGFGLSGHFDKLNVVALKIKKIKPDYMPLTLADLDEELEKLSS